MVKFPEAEARLFEDVFVCRKCKSKIRTTNLRVLAGKVNCRKCNGKALRPIKKK
jgi:ribosomal protein L40E